MGILRQEICAFWGQFCTLKEKKVYKNQKV
jgi:hypothetical protein